MKNKNLPDKQDERKDSKVQISENDISHLVLKYIDRWNWSEKSKFKKSKHLPFAFQITEQQLQKLESRVIEAFIKLAPKEQIEVLFSGEVRFPDLTTSRYTEFKGLLDKAGDERDPEQLVLNWHTFLPMPFSSVAEVTIVFTTEKPLNTEELRILEFPIASMDIEVTGPSNDWVDFSFNEILPFVVTAKIGGIYKPLLVFRNRNLVNIFSYASGLIIWVIYNRIISWASTGENNVKTSEILKKIVSKSSIDAKFDEFVKVLFGPIERSPIFQSIFSIAGGLIVWMIGIITSMWLLPYFVPKSGICIGLSKNRYDNYINAFKLIVFTIIISGILLPVIINLIT